MSSSAVCLRARTVTAAVLAGYATLMLGPHLYMIRHWPSAMSGPSADHLAQAFAVLSLSSDLIFLWLLSGFARVKLAAQHPAASPGQTAGTGADPDITLVIPVCGEEESILLETFAAAAAIDYPGLKVLIAENSHASAHQRRVHALARDFGFETLCLPNRGTKAAALNAACARVQTELLLVLDADVVAEPAIARQLVRMMGSDPGLAFVQSPQRERNAAESWIAAGAASQQCYFYEFVAEGMGQRQRALCVGTNCLMRLDALRAVGGWPEDTVTEDVELSWRLHRAGYRSAYLNRTLAHGLAPTTWRGLLRQRARHAQGATTLLLRVLRVNLRRNRPAPDLSLDYLSLMSFPLVAPAYGMFLLAMALAGRVAVAHWSAWWIHACALSALLLTQVLLLSGMHRRGYGWIALAAGQGATLLALPAYLLGIARGLSGQAPRFRITPKRPARPVVGDRASRTSWLATVAVMGTGTALALAAATSWSSSTGAAVLALWLLAHVAALISPRLLHRSICAGSGS